MFKIKFHPSTTAGWAKIKPVFHPVRVWRWLMGVFLFLVLITFVGSYFSYKQIANLEISSQHRLGQEVVPPNRLDTKTLARVLASLESKATRTETVKLNPPLIANPALLPGAPVSLQKPE